MLSSIHVVCRKPNAKVEAPEQKYNPLQRVLQKYNPLAGLLAGYFTLLQQARFKDTYIMGKMAAVLHMVATPDTLLQPDVFGRALLYWFRSFLHV